MQAIILAGGFGTRLQQVLKDVPKPMADISGKPFLHYLLSDLQNQGFKDVVISVGYLKEKIIEYFGNSYLGLKISYAPEEEPLGTGGAIVNSLQFIDKTKSVAVLNGDSFLQINYQNLFEFHHKKLSKLTIVLRQMADCSRYGAVLLDGDEIINFEEKSEEKKSGFINGGIYIINPNIFDDLKLPKSFSFEKDVMMKCLKMLEPKGFSVDRYFIDIGIPDDYKKAQDELKVIIEEDVDDYIKIKNLREVLPLLKSEKSNKNKVLLLDRDGVINIDYGHVFEKEKFHFVDGIFEICKKAQDLGYLMIIVTNQAGIAKGMYTEEQFLDLTNWMENEFAKRQIKITKTFYCPYHSEGKIEKYRQDSFDRKPNPGMILKAIKEFNVDLEKSIIIGDKQSDIEAGRRADIANRLLLK